MTIAALDLAAVKARQRDTWASGDHHAIATLIAPMAERLCESAGLRAGDGVLDVACGSGSVALAAARRNCEVTGLDYVPSLLHRAAERAAAEAVRVQLVEGDAEALPFGDGAFDAVLSAIGVMFAPDQERAAAELLRVCRPGGTIALTAWTPDGFIGEMLRLVGRFSPPPPGLRSPAAWGSENRVRELLAGAAAVRCRHRTFTFRFTSVEAFADLFLTRHGPALKAAEAQTPARRDALRDELCELIARCDDEIAGSVAVGADYLEVLATR